MSFLDSLDIANRALQHCGISAILSVTEDSKKNTETANAYDKTRRAELRRNIWRFSIRRAVLRALTPTSMLLTPALFNSGVTYLPGAIVADIDGQYWTSALAGNLGNTPGSTTAWDEYFGPLTADLYDSTIAYSAGELVYKAEGNPGSFVIFKSLTSANSAVPDVAVAWSAVTTYGMDAVVSNGGFQWRSLLPFNLNITPAVAPNAYSAVVTYSIAQTVTGADGYIYSSVGNGNVGHEPTTNAGVNWTNTTVPAAWAKTPLIYPTDPNWVPILADLTNMSIDYPLSLGASPTAAGRATYRLPCGFLREAPLDPKQGASSIFGAPGGSQYSDFLFEGNYIVTAQSPVILLRFAADITDVTKMDDMFCEGMAARVALGVVEILTNSTAKFQSIGAVYKTFMGEARTVNAIEKGPVEPPEDDFITCRA